LNEIFLKLKVPIDLDRMLNYRIRKGNKMGNWNKNNDACTSTWVTLKLLNQNDSNFTNSEKKKMNELTFWNSASTNDLRLIQAKTLAIQMDNIFTQVDGAVYENDSNKEKAIDGIVNILINSEKTISDLAEVNDANYLFWLENEII